MNPVKLTITPSNASEALQIVGEFSDGDLKLLSEFNKYFRRMSQAKLCKTGIPRIANMKLNASGLKFDCDNFEDSDMFELLHLLRPLILEKERCSFENIRTLISRRFSCDIISSKLKEFKREFDHGFIEGYLQLQINGKKLFNDTTFKLWLNGEQYHTDEEKIASWIEIKDSLTEPNTRAYLSTQICSKVSALEKLFMIVDLIVSPVDQENKKSVSFT